MDEEERVPPDWGVIAKVCCRLWVNLGSVQVCSEPSVPRATRPLNACRQCVAIEIAIISYSGQSASLSRCHSGTQKTIAGSVGPSFDRFGSRASGPLDSTTSGRQNGTMDGMEARVERLRAEDVLGRGQLAPWKDP